MTKYNLTTNEPLTRADLDWAHALNQAHASNLSQETPNSLSDLFETAYFSALVSPSAGFLICFDQTALYKSPNFKWMLKRFDRFCYVDRIVVSDKHAGHGIGRQLYQAAMAQARRDGHTNFVCEVNTQPPNEPSLRFHERFGFSVIGEATHKAPAYGPYDKTVAYMQFDL